MQFDPSNSECRVFTKRTGILSAVGHDLELAVGEYRIDVTDSSAPELRIDAEFAACSVRVVAAVVNGTPRQDVLSTHDQDTINRHIAQDVLESARYPYIVFRSMRVEHDDAEYRIHGLLSLHGADRPLLVPARRVGERIEAQAVVHQPAFGVRPFKAFAGALKVHPDAVVRISATGRF